MQFRFWLVASILGLAVSSGAFLILPPQYHGHWVIPHHSDGSFHVDADSVTARFRSAELKLRPVSLEKNEDEVAVFLSHVEVVQRPSTLDIRSVWKNIGYFYAVRKHGIHLHTHLLESNLLRVRWNIHSKYSGDVTLRRSEPVKKNEESTEKLL